MSSLSPSTRGPRTDGVYLVLATAVAALIGLALADLGSTQGRLSAASLLSSPFLDGFETLADDGSRRGDGASTIRVAGLWEGSMVRAQLVLMAKGGPRRLRVFSNESLVADLTLGNTQQVVAFATRTSQRGELLLRIHGGRRDETVYRLFAARVYQDGPRRVSTGRGLRYLLLGAMVGYLAFCVAGAAKARWVAGSLLLASSVSVALNRVESLPHLDVALLVLAVMTALRIVAGWIEVFAGMPVWASWPALLITAARIVAACDPGFGSIDAPWHTHQLVAFKSGQLTESTAPGVARSPYPPAFYAAIVPFWSGEYEGDVRLVRVAMMVIEGATPFLVFALGITLGLAAAPAGAAALVAACLPEGLLVLEKGIAANIVGQFAMLLCVLVFARRAHWVSRWAAVTLLLLSHAPAATLGLLLLALWWALGRRAGRLDNRQLASRIAVVAAAALVAWAIYYREVSLGFGHPHRADEAVRLLDPSWYRVAKIAQDLVLKFGGAPVVLAALGFRRLREAPLLQPLAVAWSVVAATFAAVAVLTPFPLRFEYFAGPLLSLLAGVLVATRQRALTWCWWASGVALVIQVTLGILWRLGYFDVIAVIMESPRWR